MKMYSGSKAKNKSRESDVHEYHGSRWVRRTAKSLRKAERQEAKNNLRKQGVTRCALV